MLAMDPVSHETPNVGHWPLQSNYATDISECMKEGINRMINAHILLYVLIIQAYYAYIGSVTTVGVQCK
jgi:hypothetical protein